MILKNWLFYTDKLPKLYRKWYSLANKIANKEGERKFRIDVDLENCSCDPSRKTKCLDAKCVIDRFH